MFLLTLKPEFFLKEWNFFEGVVHFLAYVCNQCAYADNCADAVDQLLI